MLLCGSQKASKSLCLERAWAMKLKFKKKKAKQKSFKSTKKLTHALSVAQVS